MKIDGRLATPSFRRRPESRGAGAGSHYRHSVRNSLQRRISGGVRTSRDRRRVCRPGTCTPPGPSPNHQGLFIVPKTTYRHCYESRSMSQATELPRTEVRGLQTWQTGGFSPRDIHARGEAYPLPQDAADFRRSYVAWQCHGVSRAEPVPYPDTGRESRWGMAHVLLGQVDFEKALP